MPTNAKALLRGKAALAGLDPNKGAYKLVADMVASGIDNTSEIGIDFDKAATTGANTDSNGNKIYDDQYGKRMLPALFAKEYNCNICEYHTIWENYFLATATICQLYLLNDGDPNLLEARLIEAHKEWYKYQLTHCKSAFAELHFMIFEPAFSTTYIFLDLNPYSLMPAYLLLLE